MNKTLDVAAVALATVFLFALAVVLLLGISDPQKASVGHGMPVSDAAGPLFYRMFASRNLVFVASGALFLVLWLWTAVAILVSLTATLALFDITVLSLAGVNPPAFHAVTLMVIVVTAAPLSRRAHGRSPDEPMGPKRLAALPPARFWEVMP